MTSSTTDRLYNTRLLNAPPESLTEYDLASRTTLVILCSILEAHDPPSASCLPNRTISEFHANWLVTLPNFDRVGHIAKERDFYDGLPVLRLYLLVDWKDTQTARLQHDEQLRKNSEAWLEERMRWWRLKVRLIEMFSLGYEAAQAQIEAHRDALKSRHEISRNAAKMVLNALGWNAPISVADRYSYNSALAHAQGVSQHAYSSVTDFHNMKLPEDIHHESFED